ncbi:hypothetical protein [Amycolatopsis minnesotensis]|uniref:Small secreted protein n=1 Tax=Amycolatopsis minnesotensis TaxID=337894 RepID=A0ABP5BEP9_9PSEU
MKLGYRAAGLTCCLLLAGCSEVDSAVDTVSGTTDKVSACAEAIGLADLHPDPEKLKARAEDKVHRLRELATNVQDSDVKKALFTMADGYVEVQKEHVEDLGVLGKWIKRNVDRLDQLRKVCL